ncbi:ABC transporter substrate-binding protein [Roseomonas elaeocarpi]|uniref:ABC transporter substrate-binding protein n=1 Tax=Roseomonas elaeocarpi TaxID=907779 RepID=A0ABV6JSW4_9PROT
MSHQMAIGRRPLLRAAGLGTAAAILGRGGRAGAQAPSAGAVVNIVNTRGTATSTMEELMRRRGHLGEMGLKPNAVYVADASKLIGSLISGESDICIFSGVATVLTAIDKGAKIRLLSGSMMGLEHAIYARNPAIRSVRDLEGKTLGSGSTGALLHVMWAAILRKYGVDERKVRFVNIGGAPDVFRAVAAGVVDAGIAEIDVYDQQDKYGVHVLAEGDLWKELPDFIFQGAYASETALQTKREVLKRTLAAYAKLFRFVAGPDSEQDFVDAQRVVTGNNADERNARWQWRFFRENGVFATDLALAEPKLRYMQELNVSLGVQRRTMPLDEITDRSLAREAVALLA